MIYRLTIKHGELEFVQYMTEQGLDEYKVIRYPIVQAYRYGPFLWEEKNVNRAIHKILYETDCIARNN